MHQDEQYRGYMRVRIQQLVDKFFEARKYRADEFSMADSWLAAQNSQNEAFVSIDLEEQTMFSTNCSSGTALGKPRSSNRPVRS